MYQVISLPSQNLKGRSTSYIKWPDKGRHVQSTMWAHGTSSDLTWPIREGLLRRWQLSCIREGCLVRRAMWAKAWMQEKALVAPTPFTHLEQTPHFPQAQPLGHSLRNAFPDAVELARAIKCLRSTTCLLSLSFTRSIILFCICKSILLVSLSQKTIKSLKQSPYLFLTGCLRDAWHGHMTQQVLKYQKAGGWGLGRDEAREVVRAGHEGLCVACHGTFQENNGNMN